MKKYKCKYDIDFQNIKEILDFTAAVYNEKTAVSYKTADRKHVVKISYKKLRADVDAAAAYMLSKGLGNKRIAIIGQNSYSWLAAYYGVLVGVGVAVPLDKGLTEKEIVNSLKKSGADAIIYDEGLDIDIERIIKGEGVVVNTVIPMSDFEPDKLELRYGLLGEYKDDFKVIDNDAVDIILFTSGTTTDAKAAMLSQRNIAFDIAAMRKVEPIYEDDVAMIVLPFHHAFGCTGILFLMSYGTENFLASGLKYFQKEMAELRITTFFCVPLIIEAMINKVLKTAEKEGKMKKLELARKISKALLKIGIDIRRKLFKDVIDGLGGGLRVLISGAAAINPKIIEYATDFGILVLQGYGLTETSPVVSAESYFHRRIGSVGKPMPGMEVKIVEPDEDGIGVLYCKGPMVMHGYLDDDEANRKAFSDGWYNTGDLARIDNDGFIYITGRKKNVIVLKNGKNVYPEEIEAEINRLPFVAESIVSGIEADGDYRLAATVVLNEDELPENKSRQDAVDEAMEEINCNMPKYKRIKEVIIRDTPFEKTSTQKIKREK